MIYQNSWRGALIIGKIEYRQAKESAADGVGDARSVVTRLWKCGYHETENAENRPGQCRLLATTECVKLYMMLTTRRNRIDSASQLQR